MDSHSHGRVSEMLASNRREIKDSSLICCCDLQKTVPRERESLQLRGNEDDFVAEFLRAMGYETEDTVVRTQKNIPLTMGGEMVSNQTSVSWTLTLRSFSLFRRIRLTPTPRIRRLN